MVGMGQIPGAFAPLTHMNHQFRKSDLQEIPVQSLRGKNMVEPFFHLS
jgi:hypothetical protein